MLIGGSKGPPRLAVPVPIGVPLNIGQDTRSWLTLPGEGIDDTHAQMMLQEDARLRVKHVGGADGGTWINRARIHEGVLREEDTLIIGPYRLNLRRQGALPAAGSDGAPDVILEDEASETALRGEAESHVSIIDAVAPRQTVRWVICSVMLLGAAGYLGWWMLSPHFSKDMPTGTLYRCPVDGSVFRGEWTGGPPKCPQCGALCLGTLRYKTEKSESPDVTTSAPASKPSAAAPPEARKPKPRENGGGS